MNLHDIPRAARNLTVNDLLKIAEVVAGSADDPEIQEEHDTPTFTATPGQPYPLVSIIRSGPKAGAWRLDATRAGKKYERQFKTAEKARDAAPSFLLSLPVPSARGIGRNVEAHYLKGYRPKNTAERRALMERPYLDDM